MRKIKAALLAELRKQLLVVYAGIGVALLYVVIFDLGSRFLVKPSIDRILSLSVGALVWFVLAALAGGLAFARKRTTEPDYGMPSNIPVSVGFVKISVGALSAFLAGAVTIVVLAFSIRHWSLVASDSIPADLNYFLPRGMVGGSLLVFGCSVVFSSLLARVRVSAVLGLMTAMVILIPMVCCWLRLDFHPSRKQRWIMAALVIDGLVLLLVSWVLSTCAKPQNTGRRLARGSILIIAVGVSTFLLLSYAQIRASRTGAEPFFLALSPTGETVISTAGSSDSGLRQIWLIPTSSAPSRRVVKRHAYEADCSSDSRWVTYFSQEGILGLRSDFVDLRACRVDGTQEQILLSRFTRWYDSDQGIDANGKAFSPDGKRVALICGPTLHIASTDGLAGRQFDLRPTRGFELQLLGWRPDGSEIVFLDGSEQRLAACDPGTGRIRTICQEGWLRNYRARGIPVRGIRHVLLGSHLIDLDRGTTQVLDEVDRYPHWLVPAVIADDRRTLVYAVNTDSSAASSSAQLRRRDIETGRDEPIATFTGRIERLFTSPVGTQVAVELWAGVLKYKVIIVHGNAITREFGGWCTLGWTSHNQILLVDQSGPSTRMALGDNSTGDVRQFYP